MGGFRNITGYGQARKEREHRTMGVGVFDLGLMTKIAPTAIPFGRRHNGAMRSRNMRYDAQTMASRMGSVAVVDNPVGAAKIADFEPDESWGGEVWTTNFVQHEAEADGTRAMRGERTTAGTTSYDLSGLSLVLRNNPKDSIHLWLYGKQIDSTVTGWNLTARIMTDDSNYWEKEIVAEDSDEIADGDFGEGIGLYFRSKKYEWTATGTPDWTNITKLQLRLAYEGGTGTLSLVFDNWMEAPAQVDALFQYRREFDPFGRATRSAEYAIAKGGIYKLSKANGRWELQTLPTGYSITEGIWWDVAVLNDNAYLCNGEDQNLKIIPDGTIYGVGIETPPSSMSGVAGTAGEMSDGTYYIVATYWSSITGIESAPDDKVTGLTVELSGGGSDQSIDLSAIPVSTDPQVTHVRIYVRPDTELVFQRGGADLNGEVANGELQFTLTLANSDLGDEIENPDIDQPPKWRLMEPYGSFMTWVAADEPGVFGYSNSEFPENASINNRIRVGEDDNDVITGIKGFRGAIFVTKNDAMIPGYNIGSELVLRESISDRGCDAFRSLKVIGNRLYWKSEDGIYYMGTDFRVKKITELNEKGPVRTRDNWDDLVDPFYVGSACAIQNKARSQYMLFFRELGANHNSLAWVVHVSREVTEGSQMPDFSRPHAGSSIYELSGDSVAEIEGEGDLQELWIATKHGVVLQVDHSKAEKDDGLSFTARHMTPPMSPFGPARNYRYVGMQVEGVVSGGDMTINWWPNFKTGNPNEETIDMAGEGVPWSSFTFNVSPMGPGHGFSEFVGFNKNTGRHLIIEFWRRGRGFEIYSFDIFFDVMGWR